MDNYSDSTIRAFESVKDYINTLIALISESKENEEVVSWLNNAKEAPKMEIRSQCGYFYKNYLLEIAAIDGQEKVIQLIKKESLMGGGEIGEMISQVSANLVDKGEDVKKLELLLKHAFKTTSKPPCFQSTFTAAALKGREDIMGLLSERGRINIEYGGAKALDTAFIKKKYGAIDLLLQKSAKFGKMTFTYVVNRDDVDMLIKLKEYGFDLHSSSHRGKGCTNEHHETLLLDSIVLNKPKIAAFLSLEGVNLDFSFHLDCPHPERSVPASVFPKMLDCCTTDFGKVNCGLHLMSAFKKFIGKLHMCTQSDAYAKKCIDILYNRLVEPITNLAAQKDHSIYSIPQSSIILEYQQKYALLTIMLSIYVSQKQKENPEFSADDSVCDFLTDEMKKFQNVEMGLLIQPYKKGTKNLPNRLGQEGSLAHVGSFLNKLDRAAFYLASKNPYYKFKTTTDQEEGSGGKY